jgi:hypothetical protein
MLQKRLLSCSFTNQRAHSNSADTLASEFQNPPIYIFGGMGVLFTLPGSRLGPLEHKSSRINKFGTVDPNKR